MNRSMTAPSRRTVRIGAWLLLLGATAVVLYGTRPYAGSWNDGSRLASVESIVDRHTLDIDDSTFCKPPADAVARGRPPYPPDAANLLERGTFDKLFIRGHFYSDKPAAISVLMAGLYQTARWLGLPPAAERPDLFCLLLTIATSGLAYLVALLAVYRLGRLVGLRGLTRLAWVASFGAATFALTYTRQVNNHVLLLAVVALLCLQFTRLARAVAAGRRSWLMPLSLGTLVGLGYNLDLGSGPLLLLGASLLVAYRGRSRALLAFGLAAAPWVVACHAFNYGIGGVWKPMNMVPEYSAWPGCPFDPSNMTGLATPGPVKVFVYALALLFGKHGVFTHNLPLLLALPVLAVELPRRSSYRPELLFGVGWCVATWLLYAALSNNYGGMCCSIRWFVPFLAPAYHLLGVYLARRPESRPEFFVLSAWGAVLGAIMWWEGPWIAHMVPFFWPLVAAALLSWLAYRHRVGRRGAPESGMNVARMRFIDRRLGAPVCLVLTGWHRLFGRPDPAAADRPRSILFIKLAEQGSTVLAQGALRAAVERVGRANVYVLLFAENRPILDLLDLIPLENVVAIRTRGLLGTALGALGALRRLRRARVEAVVDLEFFARSSAAMAYLSGARWRVGYHAFHGEAAYRGDLMTHRLSFNPYLHTAQAFRLMVEALDHPADQFPAFDLVPAEGQAAPAVFVPRPEELAGVREIVRRQLGPAGDSRLLLLNANASDLMPLRRWPGERYVEVARRLLERYPDAAIVFTGAPSEAEAVERLVERVGSPRCVSLAGRTTLRQLLVLYCLAEVLVTNDSGPAHFATLTPADVVVLFGPETPRLFAAVSPNTHPLWAGLACSPCINAFNDRNSACRDNVCMQRITVDQVLAEVCRLYEARRLRVGLGRCA